MSHWRLASCFVCAGSGGVETELVVQRTHAALSILLWCAMMIVGAGPVLMLKAQVLSCQQSRVCAVVFLSTGSFVLIAAGYLK